MKNLAMLAALTSLTGMNLEKEIKRRLPVRESKKCLVCNEEHFHNNSFCSAECAKEYKKRY